MAARIGVDLNLFDIIREAGRPMSLPELVEKTKVDSRLLESLLRYMASVRLIDETGPDLFAASHVSQA